MNTKKIILLFSCIASSLQGMNTGNEEVSYFHIWFKSTNHFISLRQYQTAHTNLTTLEQEIELSKFISPDHLTSYNTTILSMQIKPQHILIDGQFVLNFMRKIRDDKLLISSAIEEKKKLIKKADEESKQWLQKKIYSSHNYTIKDLKRFCAQLTSLTIMLSRNFRKDKPEDPKTLISRLHPADPSKKFNFSKAVQKSSDIPRFILTTLQEVKNYITNLEATQENAQIVNDLR